MPFIEDHQVAHQPKMAKILSSVVLIALLWATAVVVLGGVANIQKQCEDAYDAAPSDPSKSARTVCGTQYSYAWTIIAIQVFCNIMAMAVAFSPKLRLNFSSSVAHLFTIVTGMLIYIASTLYPMLQLQLSSGTKLYDTVRATVAGVIALVIVDIVYIFCAASRGALLAPTFSKATLSEPSLDHTPRSPQDMKVTIQS